MESPAKRIAIIGGGVSGITSIVACKEAGLEPICFEKTDKFGGTWCYREESIDGVASIMASTVINVSKEVSALSTFPPKKEYYNYMRHSEIYQYLSEYGNAHDVFKHITYNTEATLVKKCEDYDVTGKWEVTVRNSLTGTEKTEVFDGVMVCIGHINIPKMPHFPQQENFKGKIMHTHNLKRVEEFKNKNVVVVGIGCSGLDAAVESSNVAKQVYQSTRNGAHIMNRVATGGYPFDHIALRRYLIFFLHILPIKLTSWLCETMFLDDLYDHKLYAVKPKRPFLCQDPSVSDRIGAKLISGKVIQKPDIERFTENGVIFKGETSETKADVVIMATGYSWTYPFFEKGVVVQDEGKLNLYKIMFPTHLQHGTLSIMGFILPFGPVFPISELQARWAAHIMSGKGKLPSEEVMCKDVMDKYSANKKRYTYKDNLSIRIDYLEYVDDIASQIGAKPILLKYLFTDLPLFLKLVFGPVLSYQYRLRGPHPWDGAREAIMTSHERVKWPLQRRKEAEEPFLMRFLKNLVRILRILISY